MASYIVDTAHKYVVTCGANIAANCNLYGETWGVTAFFCERSYIGNRFATNFPDNDSLHLQMLTASQQALD